MNTFLKILLLVLLAFLALKLLPLTLGLGCLLGLGVVAFLVVGLSLLAAILVAAIVAGALLSPIWLPVLVLVGVIALIKRAGRRSA